MVDLAMIARRCISANKQSRVRANRCRHVSKATVSLHGTSAALACNSSYLIREFAGIVLTAVAKLWIAQAIGSPRDPELPNDDGRNQRGCHRQYGPYDDLNRDHPFTTTVTPPNITTVMACLTLTIRAAPREVAGLPSSQVRRSETA